MGEAWGEKEAVEGRRGRDEEEIATTTTRTIRAKATTAQTKITYKTKKIQGDEN